MYRAIPFADGAGDQPHSQGWLVQGPQHLHGRLTNGTIGIGGITVTKSEAQDAAKDLSASERDNEEQGLINEGTRHAE